MSNKITVYQIIIGSIPEEIQYCINTVKEWCKRNDYSYTLITEISKKYKNLPIRIASDYMRIDLLQEPLRAYVDWDIEIKHDIVLNNDPAIAGDCILYNGNETDLFKKIRKKMYPIRLAEGQIWSALRVIRKSQDIKKYFIDKNSYLHKHLSRRNTWLNNKTITKATIKTMAKTK